ncbi:MAG: hypothetical protein NTV69_16175, partial [Caldilinea sp.]|nr:hypothetical protein [Caldilinea sp.]
MLINSSMQHVPWLSIHLLHLPKRSLNVFPTEEASYAPLVASDPYAGNMCIGSQLRAYGIA